MGGWYEGPQSRPRPSPGAGLIPHTHRCSEAEFAARAGAPFVDAAVGLDAHFAHQGSAAGWGVVGSAHTAGVRTHVHREAVRHRSPLANAFLN
jgi:hypothetical protein